MSLLKSFGRNRNGGVRYPRPTKRDNASRQGLVERPSTPDAALATRHNFEISQVVGPDEIVTEPLELSHSLMQFAAAANLDPSIPPKTEPVGAIHFDTGDDPRSTYRSGAISETCEANAELVDTSKWFELDDAESLEERTEEQLTTETGATSSGWPLAKITGCTFDLDAAMSVDSSTAENVVETGDEAIERVNTQVTVASRGERRKHPRQESSDLIWVEYFNSSMECTGKEAARVENIGAGGMRVGVKNAPPELERVIVSYPYRGFESCSIVRSRFQDENGQHHVCVEFADREWNVNSTDGVVNRPADPFNPRKILLADDDSAFRKILGNMLIKAGYEIVHAEDGQSAVEKATSEKPDLVITDGLMPKLHGFEVCRAVKQLNPQPKVIMLTGVYTTNSYMSEARNKFGADDIIAKPCQIGDLLRKIEKHLPPVLSSNAHCGLGGLLSE